MRVIPDGEALRRLREARGLSMELLANLAGLDKMTVWRIETGQVNRSFSRTMKWLATALGCDWKELLRAVKHDAPPPDALEAEEADLSPEDFKELPDPATLPPEPLLPGTMEILSRTYRAEEGRRFTFEGRIEMPRYLDLQERVAIKCIEIEDGVCFETSLFTDGVATRVPVYSNRGDISDALFEAHGHKRRMRFVVKVLVVESTDEFGTIPDGSNIPMSVFVKWKGFTWPLPEPKQMWCLVATGVAPIKPDTDQ